MKYIRGTFFLLFQKVLEDIRGGLHLDKTRTWRKVETYSVVIISSICRLISRTGPGYLKTSAQNAWGQHEFVNDNVLK